METTTRYYCTKCKRYHANGAIYQQHANYKGDPPNNPPVTNAGIPAGTAKQHPAGFTANAGVTGNKARQLPSREGMATQPEPVVKTEGDALEYKHPGPCVSCGGPGPVCSATASCKKCDTGPDILPGHLEVITTVSGKITTREIANLKTCKWTIITEDDRVNETKVVPFTERDKLLYAKQIAKAQHRHWGWIDRIKQAKGINRYIATMKQKVLAKHDETPAKVTN